MSGKFYKLTTIFMFFIVCSSLKAQPQDLASHHLNMEIQEKNILIDKRIPGVFCYPKITSEEKERLPAVLLLHGFGSHKNEVGNLYERLAHKLAKKGIASLRIDFSGWGDSQEPMEGSNLDNMLTDAEMSYQYLRSSPAINPQNISICGFSLGAYIGFRLAQVKKESVSLIMLSPVGNPSADFKHSLHLSSLDPASKSEKNEFNLGWRVVSLGKSFFSSLLNNLPLDKLGRVNVPILAVSAAEDASYQYMKTIKKISTGDNVIISLNHSDHIFGIKSTHDQSAIVVAFISDWLVDKAKAH